MTPKELAENFREAVAQLRTEEDMEAMRPKANPPIGLLHRLFGSFRRMQKAIEPPAPPLRSFDEKNLTVYHGYATRYKTALGEIILIGPSMESLSEFCAERLSPANAEKFYPAEVRGIHLPKTK